jgi:hypothetical protein
MTWPEVALAVLPASVTAAFAYFGLARTMHAEVDRLRMEHQEEQRRSRLAVYHTFLNGDRQMRNYISDQQEGETWDRDEEQLARGEWYSAMNGVELFSVSDVRNRFATYREAIVPRMRGADLSPSNPERWSQMTEILSSEGAVNARRQLIDAMRADANEAP